MKKQVVLLLLFLLLLIPGCSQTPSRDLPSSLTWDKDQARISPADGGMNIWEGFRIENDHFTTERNFSRFILWRRHAAKEAVMIEYSLQGNPVKFSTNGAQRKRLFPTREFKGEQFLLKLSAGFNFLEISKKGKDSIKIRSIAIGTRQEKAEPHLLAGQSFSFFHLAGRGQLELSGRGQIEVTERWTEGEDVRARSKRLKSGWLSGKISHALDFSSPGTFTVSALKGAFTVSSFGYADNAPTAAPKANVVFTGKPNIHIVLSDACQGHHLGTYGYTRHTSPHIDAFARDAVVYENAYANAVFTSSSVATIFTGLYPERHKVDVLYANLPQKLLTLPEFMDSKGYATSVTSPEREFIQGVDAYYNIREKRRTAKDPSIFERFSGWLNETPPALFSYMHFIHPHFPMMPPAHFPVSFRPRKEKITQERMHALTLGKIRTRTFPDSAEIQELTDGYDSSIAWVDGEFGKILSHLKAKNLYDDSMIVFLADHGEALGEHGVLGHGDNVYEETTRVPLIVKYPQRLNLKGRVRSLVELADVFPTVASLFGQPLNLDGRILPLPGPSAGLDDRMVVFRTKTKCPSYGMRWRNWFYIIDFAGNGEKLYLLTADTRRDIAAARPQVRAFLKARFLAWYAQFRDGSDDPAEIAKNSLPKEDLEEMKTLGYL
jgi:arylsulfatase A-like enzyme